MRVPEVVINFTNVVGRINTKCVENIEEVENDQIEMENNEDISEEQAMVDTSDNSCEETEFESDASEDSDDD
ncbi:hypothetical protein FQA39_LY01165 [Lamprigera yunnana]|nr:hypothetical protein FQA39_LY01165 [Lamprigera yunnana]